MQRPSEPVKHGKKTFWENQGLFNFAQRTYQMEQPNLRKVRSVPLKSIPIRWKKYSNKNQFSLVENQIDKNARLESPKIWRKTSILFCWEGLAKQEPVRADWYENCSFYVESLLENLKLSFRTILAEKTLKTKLCCFLSEKTLHHILAELSCKLTWRFFVSEIKGN